MALSKARQRAAKSARLALLAAALVLQAAPAAMADAVADFYRGKTMQMIIATSPGGDHDTRGRLLARHMGRLLPGEPTIVAQNMPGGVGIAAANHMANAAPRDGTVLHMLMQNMPAHQAIGGQGVKFDTRKLIFIGNTTDTPNVINSWYTTGIKTIDDVRTRELVVGAAGTATPAAYYPAALNAMAGTKFKIVTGYPGGNDVNLAMDKGEVGGRGSNSWASWKSSRPQWLAENKLYILVQIGLKRHPDLRCATRNSWPRPKRCRSTSAPCPARRPRPWPTGSSPSRRRWSQGPSCSSRGPGSSGATGRPNAGAAPCPRLPPRLAGKDVRKTQVRRPRFSPQRPRLPRHAAAAVP